MRAPVGVTVVTTIAQARPAAADRPDERHRRRRLAHRDGVDPAARLGGQPGLDPAEPLPEVAAVAPSPDSGEGRRTEQ